MPPPAMTTRSSGPSRFAIRGYAYVRHTPAVAMVGRWTDGQSARGAGVYSKLRAGVACWRVSSDDVRGLREYGHL